MDKAPDAFRIISEVADDLDVPQHVLRFWESRFPQIKPMKRGGGRRYYRPEDVALVRGIRHLLYSEGYTIRGVQRILREQGIRFVQSVWQEGAPQLARENDEETGEPRQRGLLGFIPGFGPSDTGHAADEVDDGPAPPPLAATPKGLRKRNVEREQVASLRAVLDDLIDCRQRLDAALAPGTSAER